MWHLDFKATSIVILVRDVHYVALRFILYQAFWFIWCIFLKNILEKPSSPIIIESVCKGTSARIKWKSSFDGGLVHYFFIVALSDAHQIVGSDTIADKGDDQTHQTVVSIQKSSIRYTLYVFAKNNNGVTSSEPLICFTPKGTKFILWFSLIFSRSIHLLKKISCNISNIKAVLYGIIIFYVRL